MAVEKPPQPGLPKFRDGRIPHLRGILFRKLLCHFLKTVKPGRKPMITYFLCPHRERGATASEAPEHEATVSQGGGEVGELGAEEGIEPCPESMEE